MRPVLTYGMTVVKRKRWLVTFGLSAVLVEAPTATAARKVVTDYIEKRAPSRSGGWKVNVRGATVRDQKVFEDSGVSAVAWKADPKPAASRRLTAA